MKLQFSNYFYDIYDPDTDGWIENDYRVSVPGKPVYYQMSEEEYNIYAQEYNAELDKLLNKDENTLLKAGGADVVKGQKLNLIGIKSEEDESTSTYTDLFPGDNEGNPSEYQSGWTGYGSTAESLSKNSKQLSYNGGSMTSEWSTESSVSSGIDMSHGFHFSLTVMGGGSVAGNEFYAGGYANLDYSHGTGSSETKTAAGGASGTVAGIDTLSLVSKGFDKDTIKRYKFTWTFGKWDGYFRSTAAVPVFGYVLTDISQPEGPVTNLKAVQNEQNPANARLTWTAPESQSATITGYTLYRKMYDDDEFTKIADIGGDALSYDDTGLSGGKIYTYYILVNYQQEKSSFISVPSNYTSLTAGSVDGKDGADGKSAYELAVEKGYTGTESEWLAALKGETGAAGTDGQNGTDGKSAFELAVEKGYSGTEAEWLASLVGADGQDGTDGKSAYDLAVAGGFTGTVDEWLASLVGQTGSDGQNGSDGASAYVLAVANGFEGTQEEWLASLLGKDGTDGLNGIDGQDGATAYEVAVSNGFEGSEEEWLISLIGSSGKDGVAGQDGEAGLSAFELAVQSGYKGTVGEWLGSLAGEKGNSGKSAYELALDTGFTGSLEEWLVSLVGKAGTNGTNGTNGTDGTDQVTYTNLLYLLGSDSGSDSSSSVTSGASGTNGTDGVGIVGVTKTQTAGSQDTYTITLSDGTTSTYTVTNGKDGVGIKTVEVDGNGDLLVTLSDGTVVNAGSVRSQSTQMDWPLILAYILSGAAIAGNIGMFVLFRKNRNA